MKKLAITIWKGFKVSIILLCLLILVGIVLVAGVRLIKYDEPKSICDAQELEEVFDDDLCWGESPFYLYAFYYVFLVLPLSPFLIGLSFIVELILFIKKRRKNVSKNSADLLLEGSKKKESIKNFDETTNK